MNGSGRTSDISPGKGIHDGIPTLPGDMQLSDAQKVKFAVLVNWQLQDVMLRESRTSRFLRCASAQSPVRLTADKANGSATRSAAESAAPAIKQMAVVAEKIDRRYGKLRSGSMLVSQNCSQPWRCAERDASPAHAVARISSTGMMSRSMPTESNI
jgi:hypothetical protein